MNSKPERMCVICRGKGNKTKFIRLVWSGERVVVDHQHKLPGRGAYLHRAWECWSKLGASSKWARALRIQGDRNLSSSLQDVFCEVRNMLDPASLEIDPKRLDKSPDAPSGLAGRADRKGIVLSVSKGARGTKRSRGES